MSYLVLARKYRPASFSSVSGQEHVTRTLANAIKRDRIAHAYLFAGPRGVGKTSIARIFSKALNCEKGPTLEPCLKCTNCVEIAQGTSMAVREIDGASHNSVDNVRDLIDSFRTVPPPGSLYKIYIIDEVHMLSTAAFNALLKSLEEPPPHTVFILATTEAHKIPDTVISRCQRHDLRALNGEEIEKRLKAILAEEKIEVDAEALRMIARLSEGSMRDAQSLLERVMAFCEGKIKSAEAGKVLGVVERRVLSGLSEAVFSHKADQALQILAGAFSTGLDTSLFLKEFVTHWRELLVAKYGGEKALSAMGLTPEECTEMLRQVQSLSQHDIQDLVQLAREGADAALRSSYPKYAIEALVVRLSTRAPVVELGELVTKLAAGGGFAHAAPQSSVAAPRPPVASVPAASSTASHSTRPAAVTAAAPAAAAQGTPAPAAGGHALDWTAFVRHVNEGGAKILAEHLKRVSVESFGGGVLEGSGPEFSVSSLESKDIKAKLLASLAAFSGMDNWRVKFRKSGSVAAPATASLLQVEQQQRNDQSAETKRVISNHPKIKSLQKMFPGSKIEEIKIKDE